MVDTLFIKCCRALRQTGLKRLVAVDGVSANQQLRKRLVELEEEGVKVFYPRLEFCTDNGAMIAYAGYRRLSMGHCESLQFEARPRWLLRELEGVI